MNLIWMLICWAVFGLIAGALARFLVPGRQSMGLFMTMILGIVGAIVGGFLGNLIGIGEEGGFNLVSLLTAVVGAVLVLLLYVFATKKS